LTYLINESFTSGTFPSVFKITKIIPVFKKGKKSDVNNYRPISIQCTFSKVLEKLMYVRLLDHLNKYNIIVPEQYGFKAKVSTTKAILDFVKHIITNLENNESALAVFDDLRNAFGKVDRIILREKLIMYGVRGVALDWFDSYLSDRWQYVDVSGFISNLVESIVGLLQGSILAPILFVIYINDMPRCNPLVIREIYVDDVAWLFGGPKDGLQAMVSLTTETFIEWLALNNMSLNTEKTFFMQFLTKNKKAQSITLSDFGIHECSTVKYLGLVIDNTLSWSPHISLLCNKLSRISFTLRTLYPLLQPEALMLVYHGYFSAVMTYGIEAWGGSPHAVRVFLEQKRAVRIVNGMVPRTSCRGVFKSLKILTLASLYIYKLISITVRDLQNIRTVGEGHRFPTRHGHELRTPKHRLALMESEASFAGIVLYNNLPQEIKCCNNKLLLKKLKSFLLDKEFYSVDEYIKAEL